MNERSRCIAGPTSGPWTMSPALAECSTTSCTSVSMRAEPVAHRLRQVELLQHVDHAQRVLVVAEAAPEALARAGVEHRLADVPERRVADGVPAPHRPPQILVEPQRAGG